GTNQINSYCLIPGYIDDDDDELLQDVTGPVTCFHDKVTRKQS
ncbi:unnamed protein product, partial [Didymodactylos carnosus]